MTKVKSTKRALLMSGLALIICVSMLVGSTFAWFTDSVTSTSNKIQAGTLKLDLEVLKDNNWVSIKNSNEALFNYKLWEPGYTEVKVLKVENEGTLALKWVAKFTSEKALSDLAGVIDVYVCPSATEIGMPGRDLAGYTKVGTLDQFINTISETTNGVLEANGTGASVAYLGIALKMQETAGNDYQGMDLGGAFDIAIYATQYTSESDSFDKYYDSLAAYDNSAAGKFEVGQAAISLVVPGENNTKVGTIEVPVAAVSDAVANGDVNFNITIEKTEYNGNFTVAPGMESESFDVQVTGLKANNDVPVKVALRIQAGLDPDTVKLYHYDELIPCVYDHVTGDVKFETTSFSPFTVVYDAESEYEAPVVDENSVLPQAKVVAAPQFVNTELPWGSYGQWSPAEGLEANLEAAYIFTCLEDAETAKENDYADWHCDFYVSLDRALGENQIFLGGNYGDFGWVGFHNGDVTLKANEEIGLLSSVTNNPWTYADVASFVGEFTCGVGDVNNALSGATFTVKLRLTNPENAEDFVDVATINYTFN